MDGLNDSLSSGSLSALDVKAIMLAAYQQQVLIPAFNVAYLPMLRPIAETLVDLQCFGLVEVARPDVVKFGAGSFSKVAEAFGQYADRAYVRLHMDHVPAVDEDGQTVDWKPLIQQGLDLGYDSVMIDASRLPLEENIRCTRTVVEMSQGRQVPVEAELGAVLGHEKGPLPPYEELYRTGRGFTDVDEAVEFVAETGVDWLSVAIGNIHGAISGAAKDQKKLQARLNIEHLRRLSEATRIPLVLHGGSGIEQPSILEAIQNGIAKINIGTDIRQSYEQALQEEQDVRAAQKAVSRTIEYLVKDYYHIEGSALTLAAALGSL